VPTRAAPRQPPVLGIYVLLLAATFGVYVQAGRFDFANFDDPDYTGRALTFPNFIWALTAHDAANWFPVTRITHLLDFTLFGAQAGPPHLVNALLHAIAAMLLFAFLFCATGARWRSAFVAFLFALHPLHVESVAWIAERKDVLSAVFAFLSLWAYVGGRRTLSLVAFALGLMSKPMLVTLPLLLLLLDYWPLRRPPSRRGAAPFFALAAAAASITWLAQQSSGAVRTIESFPLGLRLENAFVSYVVYIVRMFWPADLAVFYPYPRDIPALQAALAFLALASVTVLVWRARRNYPYLVVGWLWFVVTLLPVIGIVQVGAQARADRYMYIPMVGLAIMLAWGAADLLPSSKPLLAAVAAASLAACAAVTWNQLSFWQNSETLFQHAVDVTPANYLAEHNLGSYLLDKPGRLADSVTHLRAALQLRPDYPEAMSDLASALAQSPGGLPQAISLDETAARILPDSPIIRGNLAQARYDFGMSLIKQGLAADSIPQFEAALRLRPDNPEAQNNLAIALAQTGKVQDAEQHFREALRLKPDYADAHLNLGITLANGGRNAEALAELEAANRLQPDPEIQKDIDRLRLLTQASRPSH
jgi:protein O-mannosyl-transferase